MIGLVKYECGCIGFRPVGNSVVLVEVCDGDMHDDTLQMSEVTEARGINLASKRFVALSNEDESVIVKELGQLIHEGLKYRSIKRLLK